MKLFTKHLRLFTMAAIVMFGLLMGVGLMGFHGKDLVLGLPIALGLPLMFGVVTTDQTANSKKTGIPISGVDNIYTITNTLTIPLTGATNDVVNALPIKKGTLVKEVVMEIIVAGVGTAVSLSVGKTGGTANGFLSAIDATQAAGTFVPCPLAGTYPAAGGLFFSADGTIDVLLATITAMTTAPQIKLTATCIDVHDYPDYNTGVIPGSS